MRCRTVSTPTTSSANDGAASGFHFTLGHTCQQRGAERSLRSSPSAEPHFRVINESGVADRPIRLRLARIRHRRRVRRSAEVRPAAPAWTDRRRTGLPRKASRRRDPKARMEGRPLDLAGARQTPRTGAQDRRHVEPRTTIILTPASGHCAPPFLGASVANSAPALAGAVISIEASSGQSHQATGGAEPARRPPCPGNASTRRLRKPARFRPRWPGHPWRARLPAAPPARRRRAPGWCSRCDPPVRRRRRRGRRPRPAGRRSVRPG